MLTVVAGMLMDAGQAVFQTGTIETNCMSN